MESRYLAGTGGTFLPKHLGTYDFENPLPPHVVNCPTPVTIDRVIHDNRNAGRTDFGFPSKSGFTGLTPVDPTK